MSRLSLNSISGENDIPKKRPFRAVSSSLIVCANTKLAILICFSDAGTVVKGLYVVPRTLPSGRAPPTSVTIFFASTVMSRENETLAPLLQSRASTCSLDNLSSNLGANILYLTVNALLTGKLGAQRVIFPSAATCYVCDLKHRTRRGGDSIHTAQSAANLPVNLPTFLVDQTGSSLSKSRDCRDIRHHVRRYSRCDRSHFRRE